MTKSAEFTVGLVGWTDDKANTQWADTKQQKAILRQSKPARKVRRMYPQGTRVTTGIMSGTVYRHIPGTDALGGVVVVDWDNGVRGRITAMNIRRDGSRA